MASPLRIMHISTRLILGGSQENTVLSCEGQADHGHAVSLVFGPIFGPEGSMLDRVKAHGGIEAIETPNMVRELAPLKDFRCGRELRAIIREWKPDVVHTHSSKAGILGRSAAWKEKVPCIVHTIHGLAFHPYMSKWRNAIYIASEKFAAKRCHVIACVADAMRDQALAKGIGKPSQYITVYSGMEVERYVKPAWERDRVRKELGLSGGDFVLGTVARLAELKGHDDLLDALEALMKARPTLKLMWVGDGWWADRLLGRVKDLGLADRVIATGLVPSEEIPKYLQAMDVLAHPSYREGLPRTVTQALLSATPVIAYDVDGTREVCLDGETGKLVKPGDLTMLREATEWMMEHPGKRQEMGRRGQELCKDRFAASRMVEHLESIYADVLEHPRKWAP
ncbi:MAG: glycosyltransferase family 4 protein [Planctomycetota bacterium]|nr:glycosyltransferase family 4 protein [Planctomycetota bacterium]